MNSEIAVIHRTVRRITSAYIFDFVYLWVTTTNRKDVEEFRRILVIGMVGCITSNN